MHCHKVNLVMTYFYIGVNYGVAKCEQMLACQSLSSAAGFVVSGHILVIYSSKLISGCKYTYINIGNIICDRKNY